MEGIAEVVTNSAQCNKAQLVSKEDGSIIVPSYDWTGFLAPHMKEDCRHQKLPSLQDVLIFTRRCLSQRIQ